MFNKHWILGWVLAASIASLAASGFCDQPSANGVDYFLFTRTAIHDQMDGKDAATILVPAGWTIRANIYWRYDPFYPATSMIVVYKPNGAECLATYPMLRFNDGIRQAAMYTASAAGPAASEHMAEIYADGQYYLGAEIRPRATSPLQYFTDYLVPRFRPELKGATIVSTEDEPALAQAALAQYGNTLNMTAKVSRIHTVYQINGVDVEEDFIVTLMYLPLPGNTVGWSGNAISYRAPKGHLAMMMPILRMIQTSLQINLPWFNDVEQAQTIMQQITANAMDQAMIRSQIISHCQDQISQMVQETFLNRDKAVQQANDDWDTLLRDLQVVPDPVHPGHHYRVPIGYSHMYVSNDGGHVIVSNSSTFNPASVGSGYTAIGGAE